MNFSLENPFRKAIFVLPKQLSPQFCQSVIDKFETDKNRYAGVTSAGFSPATKQSTDLLISDNESWAPEDRVFCEALSNGLFKYQDHMNKGAVWDNNYISGFDIGYQIQRTSPGGFYNWHHDAANSRFLTFIFYLNDVKNKGYTEFCDGTRVQPRAGQLLIFPATHQYVHRGVPPQDELKYIMTGWVHTKLEDCDKVLNSSDQYRYYSERVKELEEQLFEHNSEDPQHMGDYTPPEGDIANSYGS